MRSRSKTVSEQATILFVEVLSLRVRDKNYLLSLLSTKYVLLILVVKLCHCKQ